MLSCERGIKLFLVEGTAAAAEGEEWAIARHTRDQHNEGDDTKHDGPDTRYDVSEYQYYQNDGDNQSDDTADTCYILFHHFFFLFVNISMMQNYCLSVMCAIAKIPNKIAISPSNR
jgi:hypothetical protein